MITLIHCQFLTVSLVTVTSYALVHVLDVKILCSGPLFLPSCSSFAPVVSGSVQAGCHLQRVIFLGIQVIQVACSWSSKLEVTGRALFFAVPSFRQPLQASDSHTGLDVWRERVEVRRLPGMSLRVESAHRLPADLDAFCGAT